MPPSSVLHIASGAILAGVALSPLFAQTIIDMHYSGVSCSFTSDANGVAYNAATGHLTATNLDPNGNAFSGTCPGSGNPVVPAFTQNLAATPAAPALNQAFTLSWNTSNVDYCTTQGSNFPAGVSLAAWPLAAQICSGAVCAPGSKSITTSVAGNYLFQLNCYKTGVASPAVSTLSLAFSAGGSDCANSPPVYANGQPQIQAWFSPVSNIVVTTHDQAFNDAPNNAPAAVEPFPQTGNRSISFSVESGKYVALPFTVPNNLGTGTAVKWSAFATNWAGPPFPQVNGSAGGVSYSVSQCPGNFAVSAGCKSEWNGNEGVALLAIAPEVADPNNHYCKLERGKTYYLNIVTAPLGSLQTSACSGATCTASISYARVLP